MGANSKIEWTDYTFNPWIGCSKVSPGCANCYAERDFDHRRGRAKWGPNGTRSRTTDANWREPLKWNRDAEVDQAVYRALREYRINCAGHDLGMLTDKKIGECEKSIKRMLASGTIRQSTDGYLQPERDLDRPRVFCASLADVFEVWDGPIFDHHGNVLRRAEDGRITTDVDWTHELTMNDLRRDLFQLIDATPHLDWLICTKRPENIRRMWPDCNHCNGEGYLHRNHPDGVDYYPVCRHCDPRREHGTARGNGFYRHNVWLLTSVEDQQTADARIPELLKCRDLAPVLGLSCEPLLGAIDLGKAWTNAMEDQGWSPRNFNLNDCPSCVAGEHQEDSGYDCSHCHGTTMVPGIDWVIAGGESGPGARPMHPDWARGLRDQCQAAGVPFFFKQWGEWLPDDGRQFACQYVHMTTDSQQWLGVQNNSTCMLKVGKQAAGRLLDGVEHSEFPQPSIAN